MLQHEEIIVSNEKELDDLRQVKKTVRKIILKLPCLSNSENMKYQNKLNCYHNDCGCRIGSIVSVTVTVALVIFLKSKKVSVFEWATIAIVVIVFILSAGVGKFIGILRAKAMFESLLEEIKSKLVNE